ncbi:methyltransferase domain-containing protein [Aliihoeflea aestuarii]|uniref:RsmB/NOP family class I SAM-dependent RNA methyltransferase n=1 Tax=Aliihoeflea aestuarii TaxID=453840 RepID=UPI0020942BC1|nr:RsmB/NOP family class I SAM-dependent RNA methyltransferase [Aliihoeflea aestuarii]MCO6392035.1 methyltransferase domain-containing protein [Aliihoeflea aestuarii]
MRLGGRLAAAIDVLTDMETRHRPAAEALKDWGLSHRFAGAGDRAAIGNIVYDALRRKRSAGWLAGSDTPRGIALGALVLEQGMSVADIVSAVEGDRFAPQPPTAEEIEALTTRRLEDAPPLVQADCPDWCEPLLRETFGEAWINEAAGLAARPPLDMRVNTLKSDDARVAAELHQTGAAATEIALHGLRIAPIEGAGRHPNVQVEPAFQKGWFEVQDEGSQMAASLAMATPGMQVLDYCAGAGGKTLALAATMENKGQIFAHDSDKARLAPIFDRLKRAGVRNAQVVAGEANLSGLEGQMDLVLIDAPCTGSGTWRRRPDAKWRLTDRQLETRTNEQSEILEKASRFAKPGGRVVYVTCSVFDAENGARIDDFLARNPAFEPVDHEAHFHAVFPGHAGRARIRKDRGVVLSPRLTSTDGFFVALLKKTS